MPQHIHKEKNSDSPLRRVYPCNIRLVLCNFQPDVCYTRYTTEAQAYCRMQYTVDVSILCVVASTNLSIDVVLSTGFFDGKLKQQVEILQ